MSRTVVMCGLRLAVPGEHCTELAAYRVEAWSTENRRISLQLCAQHMHRAAQLSQMIFERKFPGSDNKVESIQMHRIGGRLAQVAS
jgi:hypothetical protein